MAFEQINYKGKALKRDRSAKSVTVVCEPTDQEILEEAIQKAVAGGWVNEDDTKPITLPDTGHVFLTHGLLDMPHIFFEVAELIFNPDFAKALWGEEWAHKLIDNVPLGRSNPAWQYHLQQMVIANDPIRYLGENI